MVVPGIEPRVSPMLDNCSTTELHTQPQQYSRTNSRKLILLNLYPWAHLFLIKTLLMVSLVLVLKHIQVGWLSPVLFFELCTELATLHGIPLLTWKNDWQDYGYSGDISSKINETSLSFRENNWKHLLPMIKFHLSKENENFEKYLSIILSFTASQY